MRRKKPQVNNNFRRLEIWNSYHLENIMNSIKEGVGITQLFNADH